MPSRESIPEVLDLLDVGAAEVAGVRRRTADTRRGSGYDVQGGVAAIIYHRQALRDRDAFRAIYFDTATGTDADEYIEGRFGIPRLQKVAGGGTAVLVRASATAGAGKIWKGTRFSIVSFGATEQRLYEATETVSVGATQVTAPVPVRAVVAGSGNEVSVTSATAVLRVEDPLWDSTWSVSSLVCTLGQDRELDDAYKARAKAERHAKRRGYADSITLACVEAGAGQVALFPSDWNGPDFGINHCFVGDDAFETPPGLLTACRIAVDSARVLGADLLVFGMTKQSVSPQVTVRLWVPAEQRAVVQIQEIAKAAVVGYFAKSANAFRFTLSGIRSAVLKALRTDVQSIDVTGISEPSLATLFDTVPLARYTVSLNSIAVTVTGPNG